MARANGMTGRGRRRRGGGGVRAGAPGEIHAHQVAVGLEDLGDLGGALGAEVIIC
jgi:hypothetical protein